MTRGRSELIRLIAAEEAYYAEQQLYAANLNDLGFTPQRPQVRIFIISADKNCFEAIGVHITSKTVLRADCRGVQGKNSNGGR